MTTVNPRLAAAHTPAVSVCVISFNSASTISATLDSILQQDVGAENIELIISDDASGDDTIEVARDWLTRNGSEFHRVELIAKTTNGGVTGNCNTAWAASTGEWIKTIAADDILVDNCLSANLDYMECHTDCDLVFSRMKWFGNVDRVTPEPSQVGFFELPALEQYKILRFGSFNFAPTSFIRRSALEAIGYADERFRNIEDLPLWLRFTREGYRLCYFDRVTVNYRVSDSISKSSSRFVNEAFLLDLIKIHNSQRPLESDGLRYRLLKFERGIGLYSTLLISRICGNRRSRFSRLLEGLALLLRPTDLWGVLRRRSVRFANRLVVRRQ